MYTQGLVDPPADSPATAASGDLRALQQRFQERVDAEEKIEPKDWMPDSYRQTLVRQISQIEGTLMQVNIKGSEANLNYPGMLNEQIYSFSGLLEDADTAPNAQVIETYAGMHAKLAAQLAAWDNLKKAQVASFLAHAKGTGG